MASIAFAPMRLNHLALAAALAAAAAAGKPALAASVSPAAPTVSGAFVNIESRAANSLGFATGDTIRFGANAVTPNGAGGTVATASTKNLATGATFSRAMVDNASPLNPNFMQGRVNYNPALLGPWTLKFAQAGAETTVQRGALSAFSPGHYAHTITMSGNAAAPTFSWTPPDAPIQGWRINLYDKSLINLDPAKGAINTGQVASMNLGPGTTSHTVTGADFSLPGYGMQMGRNYTIEIVAMQTRDGQSGNLGNPNLATASRVYADFTPREGGEQIVHLPVLQADGSWLYNMSVAAGQMYYIDPLVATGYDYAIGAGNPNFASLVLPTGIGDGLYDVWYEPQDVQTRNGGSLALLMENVAGGVVIPFGPGGTPRFRVTGIETSAGLDPADTTAFVTGVSFLSSGPFTGTQTPITADVPAGNGNHDVPEPASLLLAASALAGLGALRRRSR